MNLPLIIGSTAAKFYHPEIWTSSKDVDVVSTIDLFDDWFDKNKNNIASCSLIGHNKFVAICLDGTIIEWEFTSPDTTSSFLLENVKGTTVDSVIPGFDGKVMMSPMNWLYTLKLSHKYKKNSKHFDKTRRDIQKMKSLGYKVANKNWLKERKKETYKYNSPSLNLSKSSFFSNDQVNYVYDHDSIHVAVAKYGYDDRPAYTYYAVDDAEVLSSKDKWKALSFEMKLRGALEETYVLALERSQIPYRDKLSPRKSFEIALEKVCTTITSGWFRAWCYNNYDTVVANYNDEYLSWFDQGLKESVVLAYDG